MIPTLRRSVLAATLVLSHGIISGPDTLLTTADKSRFLKVLKAKSTKTDISGSFYALSALTLLGEKPKKPCQSLLKLKSDDSIQDLYFLVELGCLRKLSTSMMSTLESGLSSGAIADAFMAAEVLTKMGSKVDKEAIEGVLSSLAQKDGSYKATAGASRSDAVSTAFAAKLGKLIGVGKSSSSALIKLGKKVGGKLYFSSTGRNRIETTSLVLGSLLSSSDISADDIASIAVFLMSSKHVEEVKDISHIMTALTLLSDNTVHIPLVLTVKDGATKVSNVVGAPVKGSKVTVESAENSNGDKVDISLSGSKLPSNLKPGLYEIKFKVTPPEGAYAEQLATRSVSVTADVLPKKVAVIAARGSKLTGKEVKHTATFPNSFPGEIETDENEYVLHVKVALTGNDKVEQLFMQLSHESGKTVSFPLEPTGKNFGKKLNLGSPEFTNKAYGPGLYSLSIIVGGTLLTKSTRWEVGNIMITWPPASSPSVELMGPKEEISHTFHQPDPVPNIILPLAFTAICLAPLGIIFVGIQHLGLKLKLPGGSQNIWALSFLASLLAIIGLNVMYFLFLNTFEALGGLLILAVPTVITGNRALNDLYAKRRKTKTE
ncbi:hypothetical protein AAMO2058_000720100 [Amorphochlora amoebiformis]